VLPFRLNRLGLIAFLAAVVSALSACGGSGSGGAADGSPQFNPAVAAQIDELRPAEDGESVAVFVELDVQSVAAGAALNNADSLRQAVQAQFLSELSSRTLPIALAASTSACSSAALQTRLAQAQRPSSGAAVRIELTSCELDLLPTMRLVRGVHADLPLTTQATSTDYSTTLQQAIVQSFDGQSAWPALGAQTLDGPGRVIAVLDTGVDVRHPALSGTKVLPGACFSTPSNGGIGFCPNGAAQDLASPSAGSSCADILGNRWGRDRALAAGCGHGTGMAAVAAMDYANVVPGRGGIAKSASILPIQVFNANSVGAVTASSGDLLAAIEWVTAQARERRLSGAPRIAALNLSLGGGAYSAACDSDYLGSLFRAAFDRLRAEGVIPVVAAGNSGNDRAISFPACVSNALPVAASRLGYTGLASYSNFSSQVRLVAIGGDSNGAYRIPTPCIAASDTDCWATAMGTSPATALVSGAVAALHALQTSADVNSIESALTTNNPSDPRSKTVSGVPALRLTPAAERLTGLQAVGAGSGTSSGGGITSGSQSGSGSSSTPTGGAVAGGASSGGSTGAPDTVTTPATRVCVYTGTKYSGRSACAIVRMKSGDNALSYGYIGPARSVSVRDAETGAPAADRLQVTLYTSLIFNRGRVVVTQDTPSLQGMPFNSLVRSVRIEPQ
jgi:hypothetical protein